MKTRIRTIRFNKPRYYHGFFGEEFIIQEKRILFIWFINGIHPIMIVKS